MPLDTLVTSTGGPALSGGPPDGSYPTSHGSTMFWGQSNLRAISGPGCGGATYCRGVVAEGDDETVRVAEMFGEVARSLATHEGQQATLTKIVHLAVEHLEACDFAGISLVEGQKVTSPASTNDLPGIVDSIQSEVDEGPCLDAIKEHEVFQTGDLAADERWPTFAPRAHEETGVRSILSLRLFVEEDTMGALNLYSTSPDAFDETDVALRGSSPPTPRWPCPPPGERRTSAQCRQPRPHRPGQGHPHGPLEPRRRAGLPALLRRASQRLNVKLIKVAEQVVEGTSAGDMTAG